MLTLAWARPATARTPEVVEQAEPALTLVPLVDAMAAAWPSHARRCLKRLPDRLSWATAMLDPDHPQPLDCTPEQARELVLWLPPFVEVVPREHAHGVRVKGGAYRKLYISDRTDQLYGEWLWQLCEIGADEAHDEFADSYAFVALRGENRFGPLTPSSGYGLVDRLRRVLGDVVSPGWTPHWFRHMHATALLLTGTPLHVVSRRLGHRDSRRR